jgi:hypothetical protein
METKLTIVKTQEVDKHVTLCVECHGDGFFECFGDAELDCAHVTVSHLHTCDCFVQEVGTTVAAP